MLFNANLFLEFTYYTMLKNKRDRDDLILALAVLFLLCGVTYYCYESGFFSSEKKSSGPPPFLSKVKCFSIIDAPNETLDIAVTLSSV